jgi:hypothetical protein
MCYRNGNKGIGMLHSTLPYAGHWDLVLAGSSITPESLRFRTTTVETIYFRWVSSVMVFVACQGCTPWFEARVGHLTGTTALSIMKSLKYILHDDPDLPPSMHELLQALGVSLKRRTMERINSLSMTFLKNGYKSLGYQFTSGTQRQTMIDAIVRQHPSDSLVFHSW